MGASENWLPAPCESVCGAALCMICLLHLIGLFSWRRFGAVSVPEHVEGERGAVTTAGPLVLMWVGPEIRCVLQGVCRWSAFWTAS